MPTIKQEQAFNNVVENGGNVSKAMRDAGYSDNTAHTPEKLTTSKGWLELVEEKLPDSLLAQKHLEGLNATNKDGIDYAVRHRYLDTAYKIKGKVVDKLDVEITKKIISVDE